MKIAVVCFVLSALIAVAVSTKCHGEDTFTCTGHESCPAGEIVGCVHDTCTCVPAPTTPAPPMNCSMQADCETGGMTCQTGGKHHEPYKPSCLNNQCACLEPTHAPHHGPV